MEISLENSLSKSQIIDFLNNFMPPLINERFLWSKAISMELINESNSQILLNEIKTEIRQNFCDEIEEFNENEEFIGYDNIFNENLSDILYSIVDLLIILYPSIFKFTN